MKTQRASTQHLQDTGHPLVAKLVGKIDEIKLVCIRFSSFRTRILKRRKCIRRGRTAPIWRAYLPKNTSCVEQFDL